MTNKNNIEKCFSKGSKTYNNQALIQKKIAAKLNYLLSTYGFESFNRLLEIGCGTGFLTQQILNNKSINEYYINDLVNSSFNEIEKQAPIKNLNFIQGDAETIDFPDNLNAIVSTSTFQWFNYFDSFTKKVKTLLEANGIMAFSTFGPNNYKEIKKTLDVGLEYKSMNELEELLKPDFEIIHQEEWTETKAFDTPLEVLQHMKLTGVNGLSTTFLGRERLHYFCSDYLQLFSNQDNTVQLTYHPIIIIAKLK